jgi:hypothetical protein
MQLMGSRAVRPFLTNGSIVCLKMSYRVRIGRPKAIRIAMIAFGET